MSGSTKKVRSVNDMTREEVKAAVRAIPPEQDFVWDGKDPDDRPLTEAELDAGIEAAVRRGRGRPMGSGTRQQITLRFERDVVDKLRESGPGWQSRVSAAVTKLVKAGRL